MHSFSPTPADPLPNPHQPPLPSRSIISSLLLVVRGSSAAFLPPFIASSPPNLIAVFEAENLVSKPKKRVEDIIPIATGHEREELEADFEGRNILEINYPVGPFGTKEAPAVVKSYYNKRIVGCPGGKDEDEHDVIWFWLGKDKPCNCPVCSQYFVLEVEKGDGGVIGQVANAASETAQQATQILQQTGVQVKNMALGAADAVRNTLGMNESNPTTTVNTTSSNTNAANSPATAGGAANPTTTTPGGANRLDLK